MVKITIFLSLAFFSLNLGAHQLPSIDPANPGMDDAQHKLQRTQFSAKFPPIALYDHHNRAVELDTLFDPANTVVFAFFFTHCVSVCSTITESLKSLQPELPAGTLIAMISIDPDTDTPDLLGRYIEQHGINDRNWYLLTGDNRQIVDFQKSFEAYRGNKMNHSASLFVKQSNSDLVTEFTHDFADIAGFLGNHS